MKREKTYRWLVCSWSLESCAGCEPDRRSRQMAWRAATSRANPCRATLPASHPPDQQVTSTRTKHSPTTDRKQDRTHGIIGYQQVKGIPTRVSTAAWTSSVTYILSTKYELRAKASLNITTQYHKAVASEASWTAAYVMLT